MNNRTIFVILGTVILLISGCLQSPENKGPSGTTPAATVTAVPTTAVPVTAAPTTVAPTTAATSTPSITPASTGKELPPGSIYVVARMLTPAFWEKNKYELRTWQVEVTNQGSSPISVKADIINDGQILEEKSFSLEGGSTYSFRNEQKHYINSTNVTLRLTVNDYKPVEYDVVSVSSM